MKYSDWCFTTPFEKSDQLKALKDISKYYVVGLEQGEETKYVHYQGFLQLHTRKTLEQLHALSRQTHFERRRGTVEQAIAYCKKGTKFEECGEPGYQGQRTDIEKFVEDAKVLPRATMYVEHPGPMVRYGRAYNDIKSTFAARSSGARLIWMFGPPGTGKSGFAKSREPELYEKSPLDWWWPGYNGQKAVLVDEITEAIPFGLLLKAADPGVCRVPTKGGDTVLEAETIYITSNNRPHEVYPQECAYPDRWFALLRRCLFFRCERVNDDGDSVLRRMVHTLEAGWSETGEAKVFQPPLDSHVPSMDWVT